MERQYPEDPTREVYDAAKSGDADLLSAVLQQLTNKENLVRFLHRGKPADEQQRKNFRVEIKEFGKYANIRVWRVHKQIISADCCC